MGVLPERPARIGPWQETRWSLMGELDASAGERREMSWQYLVGAYERPIQGYLRRQMGRLRGRPCSVEDAADLTQQFLVICAEKAWLSRADPQKGPFRAFLQDALRKYAIGRNRWERAQKRNPGRDVRIHSMFEDEAAVAALSDEERDERDDFDRTWAEVAVERARKRLGESNERYLTVIDDLIRTHGEGSPDLAERVGLRRQQLYVLRSKARKRFAELFEQELFETAGDEAQFREEWALLRRYVP